MAKTGEDTTMDGQHAPDGTLAAELARAYAAAHYFVTIGHREWLFGVGQSAQDIERQLGAGSYLFITAWNPPLQSTSTAENMAADQQLQLRLRESGFSHHSALGSNAQGGAVEYGWLVLDVPLETGAPAHVVAASAPLGRAGIHRLGLIPPPRRYNRRR